MSKQNERIGIEFTTNEGYQVIVIDYVNNKQVQFMFLDEHKFKTWTSWRNLEHGEVKNPFHPSIFGVGYLGVDENGERLKTMEHGKQTREYKLWQHMLQRCYSEKYHETHPTYKNCTVCQRWLCFANFLEDISKIKGYELWRDNPKGFTLNKDIYYTELGIETDCKEYSLLTTRFVTDSENSREMAERTGFAHIKKSRI